MRRSDIEGQEQGDQLKTCQIVVLSTQPFLLLASSYVATRSALKQTPGIEASAMFVDGRNRTAFILALLTLPACMYFVPGSLLNQGVEVQQIIAHAAHTDKRKMSFRTAATELPAIDLLPYNTKPPPGSFCVSRDFLRKECASANYCAEQTIVLSKLLC